MQPDPNQSKNKKIILFGILALATIVSIVLFFTLRRDDSLYSSDILLTNLQNIDVAQSEGPSQGSIVFFTGSNLASVNQLSISNDASKPILKEFPYTNVEQSRINTTDSSLLVRVDPGYLDLMPGIVEQVKDKEQLTAWLLHRKNSDPKLLSVGSPILDAVFFGEQIALITYTDSSNQLILYNPSTNKVRTVIKSTDANKIIGVRGDIVLTRNSSGTVRSVNTSNGKSSDKKVNGQVVFDKKTGYLISGDNTALKITNNNTQTDLELEHPYFFVANGQIIELDSDSNPTKIRIYDLELNKWLHSYEINNELANNKDAIRSVHILENEPLSLLFVTTSNTGFIISQDKTKIDELPSFKFPEQKTIERSDLVYDFDIGTNTAIIISNKPIDSTLSLIAEYCDCNINSINKDWRSNTEEDDLTHEDDFTGDGAPPEQLSL